MSTTSFDFTLNGCSVQVCGVAANTTLLQWLRATGRTGSKEGCAEGDCGACTVALVDLNASGERTYRAINSCITLLPMVAGREVFTVEGLAEGDRLHPVQQAMVDGYGSQCGYCTPGFVVSMFEAYYRPDITKDDKQARCKIGDQLSGNLCRCTGYRPIRDAMLQALDQRACRPSDLFQLRLQKADPGVPALEYEAHGQRFLRPTSLAQLLALKSQHGQAAELVAGATELGVYINKLARRYPFLISLEGVRELTTIRKEEDFFFVGGAATLTALEEALAGELPLIDKMLWVFASRQIRNRATLAGNLVTASPIGDMPPLMLALDAHLVLEKQGSSRTIALSEFFLDYRKTALAADEIVRWICIPRARPAAGITRKMDSYKVSKRRELDISITSAAFAIEVDSHNTVTRARLAYAGVAKTPARALKTEAFLIGKTWNEGTLQGALALLATEFTPITDQRSGATFRRDLVGSLFEKFYRGEASAAQEGALDFQVGEQWQCPSASHSLKHESAALHVTGRAQYVDDTAHRRTMLECWPVVSPHAHARILSVDTSAALQEPGVVTVLTAKDIPGINDVGAVRHDEPLLAEAEALFHGHMVALVVGHSYEACRSAAAKVAVKYEPLPAVLGIPAAILADSFHTAAKFIRRGDCAAALANSPHRLQGELTIGGQEHFYLESHAAWAELGEEDTMFVASSTQHPSEVQAAVAHVLALPRNKVVVQAPRMGGGFGGKETQGNTWSALAALAAFKTGQPVRVQLDRDVDMQLTGKRHPFFARYEVGYASDGKILAARVQLISDGGFALDLSESICDRALFHLDNAYYVPSCEFSGRVAKTNVVSHTAFRGFGGPQGMLVMEEIQDRIARQLALPPEVVRQRNLYHGHSESNTTHYGQPLGDERLPQLWTSLLTSSRFAQRRQEIATFNSQHAYIKRGLAITPVKFGISFTATFLNQAGALLLVYRDGTVQVNHGGTEMGQGLHTKLKGVVMRELGVAADAVRVMATQTDKVPNTSATAASSGSDLNGQAVRIACDTIKERLLPVAAALLSSEAGATIPADSVAFSDGAVSSPLAKGLCIPFDKVVEAAYFQRISLSATGFYQTPNLGYDPAKGKGRPFFYFAYGAAVSEVEIDGFSGMKRVLAVDILHDVGDSLNQSVDRGQIEGAFVQGMGWLTGEELKWSDSGKLLTHSASTYQIPSIGDTPARFHVDLLPKATQPGVIHGSKAVGEPPLMLAISVREAIRDAIAAFGEPGGEVALPSPATHEAIHAAIAQRLRPPHPAQ